MSDYISRQAAISAICNACGKIDCDKMDKCEKLQLPPANCSEFPNSSDTISRQQAIDTVMECYDNDELFEVYEDKLRELPPAQPERIKGRWIHHPEIGWGETWLCDQCGEKTSSTVMGKPRANFCPNCGAEMGVTT